MSVGYCKMDLIGYVGHDPKRVQSESGVQGARFSVAINRRWTDASGDKKEATDWLQIVAWGQVGANCLAHLTKGRLVLVSGRPRVQQWEAEDGKRMSLQVLADQVIFLDSPKREEARLPANTTE